MDLTLTIVVFELAILYIMHLAKNNLTLTIVVFEC